MVDRSKIYCMGCEELPTILSEIRDKGLIEVRSDLLAVCKKTTHQIAQGTNCVNDVMRYASDSNSPGAFSKKGFTCVDPYTFAFAWLGYVPESLRARAKGKVFCKGCPELEPILTAIKKIEGHKPFLDGKGRSSRFEFSECTRDSSIGLVYNEGPYFGEKFGRVEVSPEVFAAIWLGTETITDDYVDETNHSDAVPSETINVDPITEFQIRL